MQSTYSLSVLTEEHLVLYISQRFRGADHRNLDFHTIWVYRVASVVIDKDKFVPVHTMKAYGDSGGISPLILTLVLDGDEW
jgi:hypothetical protein